MQGTLNPDKFLKNLGIEVNSRDASFGGCSMFGGADVKVTPPDKVRRGGRYGVGSPRIFFEIL